MTQLISLLASIFLIFSLLASIFLIFGGMYALSFANPKNTVELVIVVIGWFCVLLVLTGIGGVIKLIYWSYS